MQVNNCSVGGVKGTTTTLPHTRANGHTHNQTEQIEVRPTTTSQVCHYSKIDFEEFVKKSTLADSRLKIENYTGGRTQNKINGGHSLMIKLV